MKNTLNILHYCIYILLNKIHYLFYKVFFFNLLFKIPAIKRRWGREGKSVKEHVDQLYTAKEYGFNVLNAGGITTSIIASFIYNPILFILKCFNPEIHFNIYILIGSFIVAWIITDFYVTRKNLYLEYFTRYEQWSKTTKFQNIFLTLFAIFISIAIFFIVILIKL